MALGELLHLALLVVNLGVDLAGDEVALAKLTDELRKGAVLGREQLEDQERRDRSRVGAPELAEVVVPGDLAAERRLVLAEGLLEERVPDPVDVRGAPKLTDRVRNRAAGADVVDDPRAGLLLQELPGQQGSEEVTLDEHPLRVDEE